MAATQQSKLAKLYDGFGKEFEPDAIRQRPVKGGGEVSYVPPAPVIRRLNELAPDWSFACEYVGQQHTIETRYKRDGSPYEVEFDEICVHGALTIEGVTREQFGDGDTDGSAYGDAVKAAGTDALKKCASLFGIALYLYEKADHKRDGRQAETRRGNAGGTADGGSRSGNGNRNVSQKQRDMVHAWASDMETIGQVALAADLRKGADHPGLTNAHIDRAKEQVQHAKAEHAKLINAQTDTEPSPPPPQDDDLPF